MGIRRNGYFCNIMKSRNLVPIGTVGVLAPLAYHVMSELKGQRIEHKVATPLHSTLIDRFQILVFCRNLWSVISPADSLLTLSSTHCFLRGSQLTVDIIQLKQSSSVC